MVGEELGTFVMDDSHTVFCWLQKTAVSDRFITVPLSSRSQAQEEALEDLKACHGCHEWNVNLYK